MPLTTNASLERDRPLGETVSRRQRPTGVILVYDGASGIGAMLLYVAKKAVGREDCPLCEVTYSALGKRRAWTRCESRFGLPVSELHSDQLPASWGIAPGELPCILARADGETLPFVLVTREVIVACHGSIEALEQAVARALDGAKE